MGFLQNSAAQVFRPFHFVLDLGQLLDFSSERAGGSGRGSGWFAAGFD